MSNSTQVLNSFEFTVLGRPQQRGSKQASLIPKRGGGFVTNAAGRPIVAARDMNAKSKDWMQEVRSAAAAAVGDNWVLLQCPIELMIKFYFARPKSHYGSGKNASVIKESSPKFHAQSPDLDKLVRAIGDSLTGVVYLDDRLVCSQIVSKYWTEECEKAVIRVRAIH